MGKTDGGCRRMLFLEGPRKVPMRHIPLFAANGVSLRTVEDVGFEALFEAQQHLPDLPRAGHNHPDHKAHEHSGHGTHRDPRHHYPNWRHYFPPFVALWAKILRAHRCPVMRETPTRSAAALTVP